MAIFDILSKVEDNRNKKGLCEFNGYLEDYLLVLDEQLDSNLHSLFSKIFEIDNNLRICVGLRLNINKDVVANQIIRYKDSFRLPKGYITCPYLIYGTFNDAQKAIILCIGDKDQYIWAKALYFLMSEPNNEYEGTRNEIISMNINENNIDEMIPAISSFFYEHKTAGMAQKQLDAHLFSGYDEMYSIAKQISDYQLDHAQELVGNATRKIWTVNHLIATWFLMKKFSYVQFMMNKDALYTVFEGDVKKQRRQAKEKCDQISYISFGELMSMKAED